MSDAGNGDLRSQGVPVVGANAEPILQTVVLTLCDLCISGAGGECHAPGCALWMNRAPDVPLTPEGPDADDFLLVLGDEMEMSAYQQWPKSGTVQFTLKRKKAA